MVLDISLTQVLGAFHLLPFYVLLTKPFPSWKFTLRISAGWQHGDTQTGWHLTRAA